jgi:hypothetical protein
MQRGGAESTLLVVLAVSARHSRIDERRSCTQHHGVHGGRRRVGLFGGRECSSHTLGACSSALRAAASPSSRRHHVGPPDKSLQKQCSPSAGTGDPVEAHATAGMQRTATGKMQEAVCGMQQARRTHCMASFPRAISDAAEGCAASSESTNMCLSSARSINPSGTPGRTGLEKTDLGHSGANGATGSSVSSVTRCRENAGPGHSGAKGAVASVAGCDAQDI